MKHRLPGLLLVVSWLAPVPAHADLALTGYSATGAFGMPMSNQERIWIRDGMIRRDYIDRGRGYTQIFNLDKRQVAVADHASRMVELHDLKNMQATTEVSAPAGGLKITMQPTGQARQLRHWRCEAHTLNASMPTRLGNEETVFHLTGQVWLARDVPEQAAVKYLVKLTRQADFFLGIPAIAKITPAQSRLMSEIVRKVAPQGLPCSGELDASYEGNGPMANLARKMPTRLSVTFLDFSDAPVKPDAFAIPAGYAIRP